MYEDHALIVSELPTVFTKGLDPLLYAVLEERSMFLVAGGFTNINIVKNAVSLFSSTEDLQLELLAASNKMDSLVTPDGQHIR